MEAEAHGLHEHEDAPGRRSSRRAPVTRSAAGRTTCWSSIPSASCPACSNAPVRHGDKLHVVERFSLDPKTMKMTRSYTARGSRVSKGKYAGSDVVQVADAPTAKDTCKEQGFINYSKQVQKMNGTYDETSGTGGGTGTGRHGDDNAGRPVGEACRHPSRIALEAAAADARRTRYRGSAGLGLPGRRQRHDAEDRPRAGDHLQSEVGRTDPDVEPVSAAIDRRTRVISSCRRWSRRANSISNTNGPGTSLRRCAPASSSRSSTSSKTTVSCRACRTKKPPSSVRARLVPGSQGQLGPLGEGDRTLRTAGSDRSDHHHGRLCDGRDSC